MIVDFSNEQPWAGIDDAVMGGLSRSTMSIENGIARFRGTLSLANGGGFASLRSSASDHDLSAFSGIVLRVRGDGRRYRFRLRTTAAFDGVSYESAFETKSGQWQEVTLPFDSFAPVFRGRSVPDHPPLDPARVKTLGLMIADRQDGAFSLEITSIAGAPCDRD
jgi:monofunctional biosynthetic peptidoglycan transglycosylase